jgi:hypothetical protein
LRASYPINYEIHLSGGIKHDYPYSFECDYCPMTHLVIWLRNVVLRNVCAYQESERDQQASAGITVGIAPHPQIGFPRKILDLAVLSPSVSAVNYAYAFQLSARM